MSQASQQPVAADGTDAPPLNRNVHGDCVAMNRGARSAPRLCAEETKVKLIDFVIAAIPIGLTPALIFALAEGWLDFGGGEKDILLALPYSIWALIFFLAAAVFIIRRSTRRRWIAKSALIATITLVIAGVVAYITSWLGIA